MKLLPLTNRKGQAAMTDSLFFLTIIVALCVLLFKFSSVYGERIDLAITNLYFKEYTNSTIKTIYYTDMPLDFDKNIENSLETDYLITAIKSDYLRKERIGGIDTNSLNKNTENLAKYNLFYTIKSLMTPLPNYDYIFYIEQRGTTNKFLYFMLKINNIDPENQELSSQYYLCDPFNINPVRSLVQRSNQLYSSSIPLMLKTKEGSERNSVSNLTIWPSTSSINEAYLKIEDSEDEDFQNSKNLRCNKFDLENELTN